MHLISRGLHGCNEELVLREFSRADFKSGLDVIISTFCAQTGKGKKKFNKCP